MLGGFFGWWYGEGLNGRFRALAERLARTADFFSVGLLAQTLFQPFRQLSTGPVKGSLDVQLRAFADDMISRLIGAFLRLTMIVVSFFATLGILLYGAVMLAGWLLLPVLPLIGLGVAAVWSLV